MRTDDHFFVSRAPLELSRYHDLVSEAACGATASFVGTVRSPNRLERVEYIEYEGYEGMIVTQMKALAQELRGRYELGALLIAHRLGRLEPGEASIIILVAAPHRKDALAACQAAIDRAKELLPVWKYEVTEGGARWLEGSSAASPPL